MKVINIKICLYIVVFLVVITVYINCKRYNGFIDVGFWWNCITQSATILLIFSFMFTTILWRLKIFQNWLVLVPDLNGIWEGEIQSDWTQPDTNRKLEPIPAQLIIKQSLFHISCVMRTNEMISYSVSFGYILDRENQQKQLCYTYVSMPHQIIQEKSRMHYGTVLFNIYGKQMDGDYWTGRNTTGCIKMIWKQKK